MEVLAQYFLEKHAKTGKDLSILLILGIICYILVAYIYAIFLRHEDYVSLANSYWNIGSMIMVTLMGILFFKEELTTRQMSGIILIILATFLLT